MIYNAANEIALVGRQVHVVRDNKSLIPARSGRMVGWATFTANEDVRHLRLTPEYRGSRPRSSCCSGRAPYVDSIPGN